MRCAVTALARRWHWTEGNGALPFPGRRVETCCELPMGTMYEIREYLGNDMVVSYKEIISDSYGLTESQAWAFVENRFQNYLREGPQ